MLSINGGELLVLLAVAVLVLGPERLPGYAQQLGRLVKEVRRIALGAREQVASELGPEFDEIDWQKLDPRQYDPRRIVREALADDPPAPSGSTASSRARPSSRSSGAARGAAKPAHRPGGPDGHATPGDGADGPPPFDDDAT